MLKMKLLEIEFFGRVQGVRFRKFVKKNADKFNVVGYVKNIKDGRVLIVAQGRKKDLENFLYSIKDGNSFSNVEGVSFFWKKNDKLYDSFKIEKEDNFILDQKSSLINLSKNLLKKKNSLKHLAIIPDGNRRWARKKGFREIIGHKKSATYSNLKSILNESRNLGIKYITFWAFSTENWKRSKFEITELFNLMKSLFLKIEDDLMKENIRFRHLGRKDRIDKGLRDVIERIEDKTKNNHKFNLQIAIDYGGIDEVERAFRKAVKNNNDIDSFENIKNFLDTKDIPSPDLIIRTSGEKRMSGFMPLETVYSELYFTEKYFPDFKPRDLRHAVLDYHKRKRRFGGN
jgi:undecaprenyl diphosphate synthase